MAIETEFGQSRIDYLKKLGMTQLIAQTNIDTQSKGKVKKLLSVAGDLGCFKTESNGGDAKILGKINYKIIYVDEADNLQNIDFIADFAQTYQNAEILASSLVTARCNIIDIDTACVGDLIKLQSVVDIDVYLLCTKEINCLQAAGDAMTKTDEIWAQSFISQVSEAFSLHDEFDTGTDISKVLMFTSNAIIDKVRSGENNMLVGGSVSGQIIYQAGDAVVTKCYDLPFSEQIDSLGTDPSMQEMVSSCIKDARLSLSGVENNNKLILDFVVSLTAPLFLTKLKTVVSDICTPTFDVSIEREEFDYDRFAFGRYFDEKISGNAQLEDGMDSIKRIICATVGKNTIANVITGDNQITTEGLLSANVVFQDENDKLCSVAVELPYSLAFDAVDVDAGDIALCNAVVGCINAKVKKDREIEVVAELRFCVQVFKPTKIKCICALETLGQRHCDLKALTVYFACEGETLWDIAKEICLPISVIEGQNPGLPEVMTGGERIVVYRMLSPDCA